MECENCGKQLDARSEEKFCTGCGAEIKYDKKKRRSIRERAADPNKPIALRTIELELRARAFILGAFFGFVLILFMFTILDRSQLIALLFCIPGSFVTGILSIFIISRLDTTARLRFNDSASFVPVKGAVLNAVESISSFLPILGALPRDTDEGGEDGGKK